MAVKFDKINKEHIKFIENQKMFVIGSAGADGFINVSPKGMDTFKVIDENTVVWLNYTGSGNETSTHVQENGRMTVMFNSFDKAPLILKLYGKATVIHQKDERWDEMLAHFEPQVGTRQFFEMKVELVLTSCGYAVPEYTFVKERDTLKKWSNKKGQEGIEAYWEENNVLSLDGVETNVLKFS
ncbi:MAG: Pyridoxamine 5'-phosphate oxidase [uncultured Sulfurovum sp.]|uniref:Pyridoxamine 5'-phosphate oxidase n=1 Tax=uncultured Sulfurovum sp. TaxID=269237 RepID=A0A6S6U8T5_9BACT|nr:MAG: Pyridoxamine 5'-phosphate oxidase [uncultured Sulfurovum sp.]